jgi:O-antigen/teichoic acid export membrane protein
MLMEAIFSISTSSINLLQKRGIFIALSNADIWGRALSVLLLLLLLGRNIEIVLWGQIFSQSLIAIIAAFILMRLVSDSRQTRKYEGMNWSEVWKFYWPVALMQILFWSQISGFRIPLRMNAGAFGLGIFSVSFGITVGFYTMFQAIFTQLYDPIFWKSIADNGCRNSDLNAYIRNHWPYLFLFTFWMIGISMSAIRVMAAERYSRYYYLIVLMSIGEMIRHSGMAFYNFTFALNKTKILILPGVFSFVLCLCGTYYLGQVVSPIAATIVSISASYLVSLFILGFFVRRSVVFKIPLLELSITLVFGALLCFILLVLGSLTHSGTTFGSSVVLAIGGLLFVLFSYSLHHTLSRIIHKDSSVDFASLTCEK